MPFRGRGQVFFARAGVRIPARFSGGPGAGLPCGALLLTRKKIGWAAPVGLGYREKKRYRSPLVSL